LVVVILLTSLLINYLKTRAFDFYFKVTF
jgi:hypothetical protein